MIRIAARLFDPQGYIEFQPLPDNTEGVFSRRATRAATLDGSAVIVDRGYSDSDRTLVYRYRPVSQAHNERAQRLVKLHERVAVATPDDVYEAVPLSLDIANNENRITLLVVKSLTEN
jgi:hypothetical protein